MASVFHLSRYLFRPVLMWPRIRHLTKVSECQVEHLGFRLADSPKAGTDSGEEVQLQHVASPDMANKEKLYQSRT